MARMSLPPGFRFHPTDVELIMYYLKRKLTGKKFIYEAISELNIYNFCPWDLPDKSCLRTKDLEWFFFCPREKKYASGARTNRATESGFWKTTGKDRHVNYKEKRVGFIKTLVFHSGPARAAERTDWVMHEYSIVDTDLANAGVPLDAYVLCKVFQKMGPGPKIGAQYGAPFNEEEWDDDTAIAVDGLSTVATVPSNNINSSELTSVTIPHSDYKEHNYTNSDQVMVPVPHGNDIRSGLGDLGDSVHLNDGNMSTILEPGYALDPDTSFLELFDLETPLEFPAEAHQLEGLPAQIWSPPFDSGGHFGNNPLYVSNFLGNVQQHSPLIEQPPLLEGGSSWPGNDVNISQQEHHYTNPDQVMVPVLHGNDIHSGLGDLGESVYLNDGNMSTILEPGYALDPDTSFLELFDLETPLELPAEAHQLEGLPAQIWSPPFDSGGHFGNNPLYASNFLGTVQQHSPLIEQPPLLEGGSSLPGNDVNISQQEYGIAAIANQGYNSSPCHLDLSSTRQPSPN